MSIDLMSLSLYSFAILDVEVEKAALVFARMFGAVSIKVLDSRAFEATGRRIELVTGRNKRIESM